MSDSGSRCDCKVGRIVEQYELADINDELATRWRGDDGESLSLRSLERLFNEAVLAAALQDADVEMIRGEVENLYHLLTDDTVSSGDRTQVENRLERDGVDVETVRSNFVSHQSIHTHLRDCLSVEKDSTPKDPIKSARDTVYAMENRTGKVAQNHLQRLADGEIAIADYDIFTEVTVSCSACGRHHEFGELLANGGCDCHLE